MATFNATSPSQTHVEAAIASASNGDTVVVPAGTGNWSHLLITKGITLQGAGIGSTVITRTGSPMWEYIPANYSLNQSFRMTGFSFNGAGGAIASLGEDLYPNAVVEQTNIRIDHNRFYSPSAIRDPDIQAIWHLGQIFGVVDNNIFDNYSYVNKNVFNGNYGNLWIPAIAGTPGYHLLVPGSIYAMYFEDNVFNVVTDNEGYATITNSQYEGRYAYRYNTITLPSGANEGSVFDVHGYTDSSMHSSFGAEVYGNRVNNPSHSEGNDKFATLRGGILLWHHNSLQEECNFDLSTSAVTCPGAEFRDYQMINKSYFFQNRVGYTGSLISSQMDNPTISCGGRQRPMKGIDYFNDVDSSPLVTSGPLASRPSSPVVGQAYWATSQSTTDLTAYVGASTAVTGGTRNPASYLQGTLYVCFSTGVWTSWYTPLTYPHPLRDGTTAPTGTIVLSVR